MLRTIKSVVIREIFSRRWHNYFYERKWCCHIPGRSIFVFLCSENAEFHLI